ncbi:hypothetical protein H6P81_008021 [Aristolochia fimbriata]|uniref:Uncharacterized protein n=1 Tax=Aristolochia fimbriata TaxID=158543 RepID=A0AAV7F5Q1_ARIFI|nr:hypothetical protein H6P81_008021 [Aristolochia fimbriata]
MKKLCRKGKIHPSPQNGQTDYLALLGALPAAILALAAALLPEDQEVLAYLVSSSGNGKQRSSGKKEHPPLFCCNCFRCYKSYWVRWDSSLNRQVIHEILEALENKSSLPAAELPGSGEVGEPEDAEKRVGEEGDEVGTVRKLVSFIGERFWGVWTS